MDKELRLQFLKTTTALITAAFGMVAALAWNSAISEAIKEIIGTSGTGLLTMLLYAIVVTVIAVLATVYIARVSAKAQASVDRDDVRTDQEKQRDAWIKEWEAEREKAEFKKQWESEQVK